MKLIFEGQGQAQIFNLTDLSFLTKCRSLHKSTRMSGCNPFQKSTAGVSGDGLLAASDNFGGDVDSLTSRLTNLTN